MKGYLFDTHTLIWYLEDIPKLPHSVDGLIESQETTRLLSRASLWEIAVKARIGGIAPSVVTQVRELFSSVDFKLLKIEERHLLRYQTLHLDRYPHRERFDLLLIAQALEDDLVLVTLDERIRALPVPVFPPR